MLRYAEVLSEEINLRKPEIQKASQNSVNTLYIGGGTPSVLPLSVLGDVVKALSQVGVPGSFREFTVEVNPEDIVEKGHEYVEGLLKIGVNRVSMGVQSFDDNILKWMNRRHNAANAIKAYHILEDAGVENISIDLIFGLPQLSDQQWKETLKNALEISSCGLPPKHISAYQLSVEPGSMLAKMVEKGLWNEASEELCEHQYAMLCETLSEAGYHHYEISNFARPGYEAMHNSAYWKHVPYVGLGPGAHSFHMSAGTAGRSWNRPDLQAYIESPVSVREYESLDEEQMVLEKIMLALRTSDGISASYLKEHCDSGSLSHALASGNLVCLESGNMCIPENRFFISDSIISDIV